MKSVWANLSGFHKKNFFCSLLMFSYSIRIWRENAVSFHLYHRAMIHESFACLSYFKFVYIPDMIYLRRSHDFVSTSFGYYFFSYIFITTHTLWFLFASRAHSSHTYTRTHLPWWMYSFSMGNHKNVFFDQTKTRTLNYIV